MILATNPSTHVFKTTESGISLTLDFYPPHSDSIASCKFPAMIYFHGGGLIVGDSKSFFPTWLQERVNALGYAFISANYRLVIPTTVHDITTDVNDLLTFLTENPTIEHTDSVTGCTEPFTLDPERFGVSGSSGGAWAAYLAAANWPSLRAVVTVYGQGGDLLNAEYLEPKTAPFLFGQPLWDLNSDNVKKYLHPLQPGAIQPSGGVATALVPSGPLEGRDTLFTIYKQTGNMLDYYSGQHEPSLSSSMRQVLTATSTLDDAQAQERLAATIPGQHHAIFPQILAHKAKSWPPTLTIHGVADSIIKVGESRRIGSVLQNREVEVVAIEVDGPESEHGFDLMPGAEEKYKEWFDQVAQFIKVKL